MATADRHRSDVWIADHDPLRVVPLVDVVVDQLGHSVRSDYVETYWLPILGPSAVWAARRLVDFLGDDGDDHEVEVPLGALGLSLGLGGGAGRNSAVVRTLARLVNFRMAATGGSTYAIRRRFPPLPARHARNLPTFLAECHHLEFEVAR